jgi:hypothetical protein
MGKKNRHHSSGRKEPPQKPSLWLPIVFALIGVLLLTVGIASLKNGALWRSRATSGNGVVNFEGAVAFVGVGVMLVLMGAVPWNWISRRLEKRKD